MTSRKKLLIAGAGVGAVLLVGVMVWFEPYKLFIDDKVDEAMPIVAQQVTTTTAAVGVAGQSTTTTGQPQATTSQPRASTTAAPATTVPTMRAGSFRSLEHPASGTARIIETADGKKVLRLENLKVSNGPDLIVILSNAPSGSDSWKVWGDDYVDLGKLKGNIGNQNYEIGNDVDLSKYSNAVVWCRRFSVGFGVASLAAT